MHLSSERTRTGCGQLRRVSVVSALESFPEARLGHVGPLLVGVWYSQATLRALEALEKHQLELAKQYGPITNLSITVKIPKAPGPEAQEWLKRSEPTLRGSSRGTVIVILERGLGAIIARTFIAGASLISSANMQVVKTIAEGVDRVRALPNQHASLLDDAGLVDALSAFARQPASQS